MSKKASSGTGSIQTKLDRILTRERWVTKTLQNADLLVRELESMYPGRQETVRGRAAWFKRGLDLWEEVAKEKYKVRASAALGFSFSMSNDLAPYLRREYLGDRLQEIYNLTRKLLIRLNKLALEHHDEEGAKFFLDFCGKLDKDLETGGLQ